MDINFVNMYLEGNKQDTYSEHQIIKKSNTFSPERELFNCWHCKQHVQRCYLSKHYLTKKHLDNVDKKSHYLIPHSLPYNELQPIQNHVKHFYVKTK